jgi:pimeloyl-ACP methyl ester carboxylesterase
MGWGHFSHARRRRRAVFGRMVGLTGTCVALVRLGKHSLRQARGTMATKTDELRPCRSDPRFSYLLAAPGSAQACGLVVVVHDSTRELQPFADSFGPWARETGLALLLPHFPADVRGDGYADGYKFLHEADIRYDALLNDMVHEAAAALGCPSSTFFLHGYSGGGQFAHRYLLLHPQRVRAASIGAPGEVTLLDEGLDWWAGVRDAKARFGMAVQPATMRRTPIQLLVGERDIETDELVEQPPSRYWRSDEQRIGANRIERLRTLEACLRDAGAGPRLELMPGMAHGNGAEEAMRRAQRFFAQQLAGGQA